MADPIKFSELGNVGELSSSAVVAIVQLQNGELVSLKCTVAEIAQLIVNGIEFSGLTSNDKKIIGAINEALAGGGGGGDVTKAYVDEQDDAIRTNVTRLDEQINGNAVALVIIDGEYSRSSDGRIVTYAGWSRTDYTVVSGLSTLEYSYNGADSRYNCFYDENKTFITSFNISATESGSVTVPSNAKYFVVSATTEDMASFRWLNGQIPGIADEVTTIRAEIDSLEKVEVKDLQVSSLIGQTGSNRETIIGNHIYYHLGFSARQVIPAGTVLFTGTPHKLDSKNIAWTTYLGDVATFDFNKNGTITNALQIAQGKAFFIDFVVV